MNCGEYVTVAICGFHLKVNIILFYTTKIKIFVVHLSNILPILFVIYAF